MLQIDTLTHRQIDRSNKLKEASAGHHAAYKGEERRHVLLYGTEGKRHVLVVNVK
jgi:hypothetical protein